MAQQRYLAESGYLRSDVSNDDDYWTRSEHKGFSFEEESDEVNWAPFSKKEAAELSETLRQRASVKDVAAPTTSPEQQASEDDTRIIVGSQQTLKKRLENLHLTTETAKFHRSGSLILESPKEMVKRIISGQPYVIDQFRSKEDKLELLDEAIASCDGNAITAAVLLLKKSLKAALFHNELMKRPSAVNHYLSYLNSRREIAELADVLSMLGRTEEAAMLKYKAAVSTRHPETKIAHLRNCMQTHFVGDPSLSFWSGLVQEQISLLEIQMPIEEEDKRQEREGSNLLFQQFPRKASVVDQPAIVTLYYCCLYHYGTPENQFASPLYLQKRFQLSQKQYVWTALAALAKQQWWSEIDTLFQVKSWLGGVKMKASIGFGKVAQVLHKANAPEEITTRYLKLVEDADERLEMAKKYKLHGLVIETLISLRDRQALEAYRTKVDPQSREFAFLQDALRASTIKWKN